jgi:hypothetical protein
MNEEEWIREPQTSGRRALPPRLPPTAVGTATLPPPGGQSPRQRRQRRSPWLVLPRLIAGIAKGVARSLAFVPRMIRAGLFEHSPSVAGRARRKR